MQRSHRRLAALAAACLGLLAVLAPAPSAADSYRHPSGLQVIGSDPTPELPGPVWEAIAAGQQLGEALPTEVGYPIHRDGRVRLALLSDRARAMFNELASAGEVSYPSTESGELKNIPIHASPESVALIDTTEVGETFASARQRHTEVMDAALAYLDAAAPISRHVAVDGVIILALQKLPDALAEELVARFGTEAVIVWADPNQKQASPAR